MSYAEFEENELRALVPRVIFVDEQNRITEVMQVALSEMLDEFQRPTSDLFTAR